MAGPNITRPALEDLMQRAQHGDRKAYAALFKAIAPVLRSFVGNRLGYAADIDDVVQDILISIHRASHTYDTARPFKAWMFAIARHRLNDHFRRLYRRSELPNISLEELTFEISNPDVTDHEDQSEYLKQLLNALPEKQRRIVTLLKLEGCSSVETAKAMNMSVSAVKVAAHRALKLLALKAESKRDDK